MRRRPSSPKWSGFATVLALGCGARAAQELSATDDGGAALPGVPDAAALPVGSVSSDAGVPAVQADASVAIEAGAQPTAKLSVILDGPGVVAFPNIDCGGTCVVDVPIGAALDLEAKPLGSVFDGWSGCPSADGVVCRVLMQSDLAVTAKFISCPVVAPDAPHYVDGTNGTDSALNGGGAGACAFRTVTYALERATRIVHVASGTYPTPSETLPLSLQQSQALECPLDGSAVFVNHNQNMGPVWGIISITGTANVVRGCSITGFAIGGEGITVVSSGTAITPHRIEDCRFVDAFNEAIRISPNVSNVRIERNSFLRGYSGVFLEPNVSNVSLTQNTFSLTGRDLFCYGAAVSGGANTRSGGPILCEQCPYCPN